MQNEEQRQVISPGAALTPLKRVFILHCPFCIFRFALNPGFNPC